MVLAVVGAGMVGCATALALKKRGHDVVVYEKRSDPRAGGLKEVGRSINLAISSRGLRSLRSIDSQLADKVFSETVPMFGRMVHTRKATSDSGMTPVLYGLSGTEAIYSVRRDSLNNTLINAVEAAGIPINFEYVPTTDLPQLMQLGDVVFGCDGTFSKVREVVARATDFKLDMETVGTHYMEVPIGSVPEWARTYLHVWPRASHMFIALPNTDGTYTGTLFAPKEIFENEGKDPNALAHWFETEFPDAAKRIGRDGLLNLGRNAPHGKLTSLKFAPYNLCGKILLLGDAAHSMVPFYGQGLNAGLEDVRVLFEQFIDVHPAVKDWDRAFAQYSRFRKPDCDAINNLSMSNYKEMSTSVATLSFRVRKAVDNFLARKLGDRWLPLYTMVSFRDDVRYSKALSDAAWQQTIVDAIVNVTTSFGVLAGLALAVRILKIRRRR